VNAGLLIDVALPVICVLLTFVACSLVRHLSSEQEHRWIKDAFSRYVSPNRVDFLVENPDAMALGGKRQECSFIFTDLAGFTSLMEKIDPGEAVTLLNDYLDEMIAIAFRHEGTLDRIVGDAVAIMFSAPVPQPDHRRRALACALEMDAFAVRYSAGLQARGIQFGKTRIGIHAGEVIVGNFGGKNIFDYRALGDPINTAARLESVNKHLGTRICVSEEIIRDCPEALVRPVGQLVLKGKSKPLGVFEPVTNAEGNAPLAEYQDAYDALAAEDPLALEKFTRLAEQSPDDPLVRLHLERLTSGCLGDLIVMAEK
jgi:adenylate cyclase